MVLLLPHPVPPRGRLKLAGAGALFRDHDGRVLLVNPTYKPPWEIPGGIVDEGESPRAGCARELEEELGWTGEVGRLLVVDWLPDLGRPGGARRGDRILFVFDGGVVDADAFLADVRLPPDELSEARFVDLESDGADYLGPGMVRRVLEAKAHALTGTTGYLEFGHPDQLPIVSP